MYPALVRHLLIPLHERIMGRPTLSMLREMERTQWWSRDQLATLQQSKLRRLLSHAHTRCPFHRDRIDAACIDPRSATVNDLSRLPLLTKSDIADHRERLIDKSAPGLRDATTGGSTGAPLAFTTDRARQAADQAARARSRRWFGVNLGDRELYLWGSPIEQSAGDSLKSLRDHLTNQRLLNAFQLTPKAMTRYLAILKDYDPVHIFGYPSSLSRLVRFALDAGHPIRTRKLRAVFTTGELLAPADRAILEEHFNVPVADGYGSREGGFIAHQCPYGAYHVTMESLIVELIDHAGKPVRTGEVGEIVITHLDALGMPFIRYRTGDLARSANNSCPCGRKLDTLKMMEGRRTDLLRRADGGHAHALSVIYVLRNEPAVAEFKVTQHSGLDLDVEIVPRGSMGAEHQSRISSLISGQLGGAAVRLHLRDSIAPDPSGKHRHVVSEAHGL